MKDKFNNMFNSYKNRVYAYIIWLSALDNLADEIKHSIFIKLYVSRVKMAMINGAASSAEMPRRERYLKVSD